MGISRLELFRTLRIIREGISIDPFIDKAYRDEEKRLYESQFDDTAEERGGYWHTSMHASAFCGEGRECARKLVYDLMNIPGVEPFSPTGRSVMDIGKQVEYQIVYRLARAGKTITGSCPLYDGAYMSQTRFELPDLWLTGSVDCALDLRPDTLHVVPFDVKGKDPEVVRAMQVGARGHDQEHFAQIQMYILFCRLYHIDMGWQDMGLLPAEGGIILYVARNRPRMTAEIWFDYSPEFVAQAMETLANAKLHFLGGSVPPRPKEWRWTQEPCNWCDFKKEACRKDEKEDVTLLAASKAIDFARSVNSNYSYEQAREAVLQRWEQSTAREEAA